MVKLPKGIPLLALERLRRSLQLMANADCLAKSASSALGNPIDGFGYLVRCQSKMAKLKRMVVTAKRTERKIVAIAIVARKTGKDEMIVVEAEDAVGERRC